jgi:hypothetical protein
MWLKKDGLTIWSNIVDHFHHLRLESHVEHTVSFVEDHVGDALEVSYTA